MNDLRDTIIIVLVVAVLTFSWSHGILTPRTYQLAENVRAICLGQGCELWYFAPPAQPKSTFALACPRTDLIRLWPLPAQQPWFEDV